MTWKTDFIHDDHTHPYGVVVKGGGGVLRIPHKGHGFEGKTGFRITASVTNPDGTMTSESVDIFPDKITASITSSPFNVRLEFDSEQQPTPVNLETVPFFQHTLVAPQEVCSMGHPSMLPPSNSSSSNNNNVAPPQALRYLFKEFKGLPRRCVKVPNVNFVGSDLPGNPVNSHAHRTHTFQECASACLAEPLCAYFTLANGLAPQECYLKRARAGSNRQQSFNGDSSMHSGDCTTVDATATSQTLILRPDCSTGLQSNTYGSFTDAYNLDNNQPMTGTLKQCIAACTGACVAFSWQMAEDPTKPGPCYLKRWGPQSGKHTPLGWTTYVKTCPGTLSQSFFLVLFS